MNPTPTKTKHEILAEITSMDVLLRGKITQKRTPAGKRNGHKLQRWLDGKNQSLHLSDDRLDLCTQAVANHHHFTELIDQYVTLCEQDVLRPREDSKKKPTKR